MPCCFGGSLREARSRGSTFGTPAEVGVDPNRGGKTSAGAKGGRLSRAGGKAGKRGAGRGFQAGWRTAGSYSDADGGEDDDSDVFYSVREEDSEAEELRRGGAYYSPYEYNPASPGQVLLSSETSRSGRGGFGSLLNMMNTPTATRVATPLHPDEEIGYVLQFMDYFQNNQKQWTLALDRAECRVWKRFIEIGGGGGGDGGGGGGASTRVEAGALSCPGSPTLSPGGAAGGPGTTMKHPNLTLGGSSSSSSLNSNWARVSNIGKQNPNQKHNPNRLPQNKSSMRNVNALMKPERVLFFCAESVIQAPPEVVFHLVQNVKLRMQWEDNFLLDEMIEGDYYRGIERVLIKSPVMGFSNREIIRYRDSRCVPAFKYPYLAYERSTASRDHVYPPTGKQVRVNVFMSGNTLEPGPVPGTTKFRAITDSNPGGSIPSAAVSLVVASIPRQWAQKLNKECQKFMAKEPVQPIPKERLRELVENLCGLD
mmetsp:Transcript_5872/g.14613  ORF Transcript_5872/g.14613 Transcript_5872/m.14613 type:complete len:482 (+) Transcript_5872:2586-4031(+)